MKRFARSSLVAVGVVVCSASPAAAVRLERSLNPPAWAARKSTCVANLTSRRDPSGIDGYIGYNVYELTVVRHTGFSCQDAKRLALSDWTTKRSSGGLSWRNPRAWDTTSGGSAYIGDFVGTGHGREIEYLAIH